MDLKHLYSYNVFILLVLCLSFLKNVLNFPTSNNWPLQWWRPHSSCLHIEGQGCHKTWSDINRSSHHPHRHHCCRVAMAPTARSRRWWSGSAAGKQTSVINVTSEVRSALLYMVEVVLECRIFHSKEKREETYCNLLPFSQIHYNLIHFNSSSTFYILYVFYSTRREVITKK